MENKQDSVEESVTEAPSTPFAWPAYPMKWYKFLIYFSLFAGAVLNFINGIQYISGAVYSDTSRGITADMIYDMFGRQLQTSDMIYGLVLWLISVLSIVARFKLARYKKDGPLILYAVYAANALASVIYSIAIYNLTGFEISVGAIIVDLLMVGIVIFCNFKYFTKRAKLFVN